jgi:alpha-pyrone synthase
MTGFWGVGTAVPHYRIEQQQVLDFMRGCYRGDDRILRRLGYLFRRSQIEARYSCCPEFTEPGESEWSYGRRSTAERMVLYEQCAGALATEAAERALRVSPFAAADITHLVFVTCTGFVTPGPELEAVDKLGLQRDIRRLQIGFMGCQAALHGLQAADAICRADQAARVLLISVELCTLHFKSEPSEENLVVNSLFGDGAAALVLGAVEAPCHLLRFASQLVPEERELISWRIGDRGFHMGLDLAAPKALRGVLLDFVSGLVEAREDMAFWAVHPGGRAILDVVERSLALGTEELAASRAILREYGNMSSPSVLFVLDRLLATGQTGLGTMLSFGPGLSLEGMVWEQRNG